MSWADTTRRGSPLLAEGKTDNEKETRDNVQIEIHALIFHTLGLNLREEVGVFCRLRVLLMAG